MKFPLTAEWLEADGLSGFASGTVGGGRTRRYHAWLLAALADGRRLVLVNGADVTLQTAAGNWPLSTQFYGGGATNPDGRKWLASFEPEPWPQWVFGLPDGTRVVQELCARRGRAQVFLRWRLVAGGGTAATLRVRPLLSGRDYHGLQRENRGFHFEPAFQGDRLFFRTYEDQFEIVLRQQRQVPPPAVLVPLVSLCRGRRARAGLRGRPRLAGGAQLRVDPGTGAPGAGQRRPGAGAGGCSGGEDVAGGAGPACGVRVSVASGRRGLRHRGAGRKHHHRWLSVVHRLGPRHVHLVAGVVSGDGEPADARAVLLAWAGAVSRRDAAEPLSRPRRAQPEYNAVDASLWFVVAVYEYLQARPGPASVPSARTGALAGGGGGDPVGLRRWHTLRHPRATTTACSRPACRACS